MKGLTAFVTSSVRLPLLLTACCYCFPIAIGMITASYAQETIPIGTWRLHLSYNEIKSITLSPNKVYGATASGILVFDKTDNSLSTINTLNGLNGTGISYLAFDETNSQLLIAYLDGNLDIVRDNEVVNFNRLKNSTLISGSKKIHHIAVKNEKAYLSTDFGVVVFNLSTLELIETWRDLSASGSSLPVYSSTFMGDSIYLATQQGVLAGHLASNLLDYSNFRRTDKGDFSNPVTSIATFNATVYAAINGKGLYSKASGTWTRETFLQNSSFNFLNASASYLLVGEGPNLWRYSASEVLTQIQSDKITFPHAARMDDQQKIWIGDDKNGLVSDLSGNFVSYLPNGPTVSSAFRLKFFNNRIYALPGGFTTAGSPLLNAGELNYFEQGLWYSQSKPYNDLTDIDFLNAQIYLSTFGYGVEKTDNNGSTVIYNSINSPLEKTTTSLNSVFISAIEVSNAGLWVANYSATKPLHLLKSDNTWQSFSFTFPQSQFISDLRVDLQNNVWMITNPSQGGGILVFDLSTNKTIFRSEVPGSGALPSRLVHALAIDREGYVWVGTSDGIAYCFSAESDCIKPIFENRFLLKDEKVTSLAVDGGNRKWVGTERGVWLFDATGEKAIRNFTTENSPLLSNVIRDIEIDDNTGEVFFATDQGLQSYRSDASESSEKFHVVKIFPNPVTADFSGIVGITGLATDALVKITDVSGKLIWQTQANGGTASWDVRDYNGKRAATGVYLVFASSIDGSDSAVGKIVVVE